MNSQIKKFIFYTEKKLIWVLYFLGIRRTSRSRSWGFCIQVKTFCYSLKLSFNLELGVEFLKKFIFVFTIFIAIQQQHQEEVTSFSFFLLISWLNDQTHTVIHCTIYKYYYLIFYMLPTFYEFWDIDGSQHLFLSPRHSFFCQKVLLLSSNLA